MPNIIIKGILLALVFHILVIIGNSQGYSATDNEIVFDNALITTNISGYISAPNIPKNYPLKNVTIELFTENNRLLATTTTNQEGYFSFKHVRKGNYIITTIYKLDGELVFDPFVAPIKIRKNKKMRLVLFLTLGIKNIAGVDISKIELKSEGDAKAMLDNSLDTTK